MVRVISLHALVPRFMSLVLRNHIGSDQSLVNIMKSTNGATTQEIRELRSDESDEFIMLMEIAFKDSIEEDRLDADELRKLLKKLRTPLYKIITRAVGMKMEFYVAEREDTIASGIQLNIERIHKSNCSNNLFA